MPAGTIALTNNSATVTGTGTSFTTELKVNDFLVSTVGGLAYTLGVKSIESNTSLTLMEKYTGPSVSGLSWTPVPYGTMAAITAQLAAQVTYAIRGLNLDKTNWQQVFTGTGTVTVTLPDGTSWQGPAWGGITTTLNSKANLVNDVVEVAHGGTGQKTLSGVMTWLGLGDAAFKNTGTTSGTLAAGNDGRLSTVDAKSGGTISSGVTISSGNLSLTTGAVQTVRNNMTARQPWSGTSGTITQGGWFQSMYSTANTTAQFSTFIEAVVNQSLYGVLTLGDGVQFKRWQFDIGGNAYAINGNWINGSDARLKKDIKAVPNALQSVLGWRGASWEWRDETRTQRGIGFIADDIEKSFPDAISRFATTIDGKTVNDVRAIDPGSIAAAYHTEAIKSLFSLVELALVDPEKAIASIDSIKAGLEANPES
jgi:hypothetical protein